MRRLGSVPWEHATYMTVLLLLAAQAGSVRSECDGGKGDSVFCRNRACGTTTVESCCSRLNATLECTCENWYYNTSGPIAEGPIARCSVYLVDELGGDFTWFSVMAGAFLFLVSIAGFFFSASEIREACRAAQTPRSSLKMLCSVFVTISSFNQAVFMVLRGTQSPARHAHCSLVSHVPCLEVLQQIYLPSKVIAGLSFIMLWLDILAAKKSGRTVLGNSRSKLKNMLVLVRSHWKVNAVVVSSMLVYFIYMISIWLRLALEDVVSMRKRLNLINLVTDVFTFTIYGAGLCSKKLLYY